MISIGSHVRLIKKIRRNFSDNYSKSYESRKTSGGDDAIFACVNSNSVSFFALFSLVIIKKRGSLVILNKRPAEKGILIISLKSGIKFKTFFKNESQGRKVKEGSS